MSQTRQLAPGLYVVERTEEERRLYSLTPEQVREMLASIESRAVVDAIVRQYEAATRPRRPRWLSKIVTRLRRWTIWA